MRLGMTFMAHWNADTEFASSVNHTTTPNSFIAKKKKGKEGGKKNLKHKIAFELLDSHQQTRNNKQTS
jgi:hypothetical protein